MYGLRLLARVTLGLGLLLLAVGVVLTGGSAVVAGDWWLARQPWIGIGLTSLIWGLAVIGLVGLLLNVIEPIGRVRILAIPPALLVVVVWLVAYMAPLSGACCEQPERDMATLLYSQPQALALLIVGTLAILLPLAIARRRLADRRK
ncbi:MAG: hypothetical protein EPO00_04980 [Chloroflexota bacterium]|nr:MAG: hypothetical protein EPO00_04980 [Chloroflexota bacterium]